MQLAVAQIPFRRLLWAPFPSDVTKAIRCVVDDDDDDDDDDDCDGSTSHV